MEPELKDIQLAAEKIKSYIHKTPVLTSSAINQITGAEVFFKCENFQKVGAFKIRGATNAVLSLTDQEAKAGVATHSSGNHAAALALAAKQRGIKAYIVMPENAPAVKKAAVAGYGAEIIFCPPTLEDREKSLADIVKKTGATFIPPYNDYRVIAGQGTAALELIEEAGDFDSIMAPIGGGGLLSGTLISTKGLSPKTQVIAGEPENVDDAFRSLKEGKLIPVENSNTIADGLKTSLGDKTFPIIQRLVDQIVTVSEDEIKDAMRLIWERMKIIVEPSSAVPFAALLQKKEEFKGKKVGIILSGGNVDLGKLPF